MTHKDTTMLELCGRALVKTYNDNRKDGSPSDETVYPVDREAVRAILNELKQPSEGMVKAASLAFLEWEEDSRSRDGFERPMLIAAIDFVLNEGEGNTTS